MPAFSFYEIDPRISSVVEWLLYFGIFLQVHARSLRVLHPGDEDQGLRSVARVVPKSDPGVHGRGVRSHRGLHGRRTFTVRTD